MPKVIDIPQNTSEWRLWRRPKIGASDLAAIENISPWTTPLQLFDEKKFGKERAPTKAMMRGTKLEAQAREMLGKLGGIRYEPKVLQSDEFDWAIASLDGYCESELGSIWTAEIKIPNSKTVMDSIFGMIPDYYMVQCQWQIYVSGSDQHLYATAEAQIDPYTGEERVKKIYPVIVPRDQEMIERLKSSAMDFKRRLDEFDPPEPVDRDVVKINDSRALELSQECYALQTTLKDLQKRYDFKREELEKLLEHPRCEVGDYRILRSYRKGNIDYSKIPDLEGKDLEPYRKKPSSFMTIRLKKEKTGEN